jgi:hypothetical protein
VPARPVAIRGADEACIGGDTYGGRMSYARRRFLVVVLLILSGMVGGCALRRPAPVDRSILTDAPYAAPCWQGIVPGQTTADEAFQILTELGHRPRRGEWGSYIGWYSAAEYHDDELMHGPNSLDSLQIAGPIAYLRTAVEFELSARDILHKYGLPEAYRVYESMGTLSEGGHTPIVVVLLYYVQQGLLFESWILISVPPGETVTIDADMKLDWIYYLPPTSAERLMEDNPRLKRVISEDKPLQDWHGFPIEYRRSDRGGIWHTRASTSST